MIYEGHTPAYLICGLIKPLQELNNCQKSQSTSLRNNSLSQKSLSNVILSMAIPLEDSNKITSGSPCDCHLTLQLTVVGMASFQLKCLVITILGYKFTEEISIKPSFSWYISTVFIRTLIQPSQKL